MGNIEKKLSELGHTLPPPSIPEKLEYGVQSGSLIFLSGCGSPTKGKLGDNIDIETGYIASQECCLQLLSNLREVIEDLDRVTRVVKLLCMVNCAPEYKEQPAVAYGCTDLLLALYGGKAGKHARSAVGMAALPEGSAVEIEMIVEVA